MTDNGARLVLTTLVGGLLVMTMSAPAATAAGRSEVTVCPSCAVSTVQEGLGLLMPGGTLTVQGGTYDGPVEMTQEAHIVGVDNPVIDGGGGGTVLLIEGDGSSVEGLVVRGSGTSLDHEDAGIAIRADDVVVAGNRVLDSLFGIYAKQASRVVIENNEVTGKDLPAASRGDGIRVYDSQGARVVGNEAYGVRDNLMWFSNDCAIENNYFHNNRYGLHFMWSNDCTVTGNTSTNSSVGFYFMYSVGIGFSDNVLKDNRESTGLGIGLRDVDDIIGENNVSVGNHIGLASYNSPRSTNIVNEFRANIIAYNDIGMTTQNAGRGNLFAENSFIDNIQQVTTDDGSTTTGITWSENGRGNYWSDYSGYDGDGDGIGDVPYSPSQAFESLVQRDPDFALFYLSPSAQALDWAANTFPVFTSSVMVTDPAPLTVPVAHAGLVRSRAASTPLLLGSGGLVLAAVGLILLAVGIATLLRRRRRGTLPHPSDPDAPLLVVRGLGKRYGDAVIFTELDLEVRAGEVLALWGGNGAGKTTVLRCILGLISHEGEVRIGGWSTATHPRRARAMIGAVAQEPAFHGDLTVAQTMTFYSRLRGVADAAGEKVLEMVGLVDAADKRVDELSGGMLRKLAVAVALLGDAGVLLLDEPTSNLDQRSRQDIIELLVRLKSRGMAMILASHQPDEITALADRVMRLSAGKAPTETDMSALQRRVSIDVPEGRHGDAIRALIDAGIPVRETVEDAARDGEHAPALTGEAS